jgi:dehydrogenase/reductase SDR family protein 1
MSADQPVCIVTGGSRGIGRGIASSLCQEGCIVYVTGRTEEGLLATCAEATKGGHGTCIAQVVDHSDDASVEALFHRIDREQNGRIDLLVNNAFAGAADGIAHGMAATGKGFWDKPLWLWEKNCDVGLRSHYVASAFALQRMVPRKNGGLVVNVSSRAGLSW